MGSDDLTARYGDVEKVYRPSRGQTAVGVLLCGGAAAVLVAVAAAGTALDATNRVCAALLAAGAVWAGWWLSRQGRWRLAVFTGGLVQVRAGGVDEVAWADVREVVRTRLRAFNEPTIRLTLVAARCRMVVTPVNYRGRTRLFESLVAAAERRGIPVRVEWEETD